MNAIIVNLNGTNVGLALGADADAFNCTESTGDLIVPVETFNDLVAAGDALFTPTASPPVAPDFCPDPSFVQVTVSYGVPSALDADGTGIVDECECAADLTGPNGAPDGAVDALDFLLLIGQWGSPCSGPCDADVTGPGGGPDDNVDALDFLLLIGQWGGCGGA